MKNTISLLLILGLIACAKENKPLPSIEKDYGSIAKLNEDEIKTLQSQQIKVRQINKEESLYHIENTSATELNEILGTQKAIQNIPLYAGDPPSYPETVEQTLKAMQEEPAANSKAEPSAKIELPTCKNTAQMPLAVLNTQNVPYKLRNVIDIGSLQTIQISGLKSLPADIAAQRRQQLSSGAALALNPSADASQDLFLRHVERNSNLPGQESSRLDLYWLLQSQVFGTFVDKGTSLEARLPAVGTYVINLLAYDKISGGCSVDRMLVRATANPKPVDLNTLGARPELNADIEKKLFHLSQLHISNAKKTFSGKRVKLAILDSGVNYNHPSLRYNILVNEDEIPDNGIDDDENGFIDDVVGYDFEDNDGYAFDDGGHGSHVAGIAAGSDIGIASDAQIVPIKVSTLVNFIESVNYMKAAGVSVVNISLGFNGDMPPAARRLVRNMLNTMQEANIVVSLAAGNEGTNINQLNRVPANMRTDNMIVVGALKYDDSLTGYSNMGNVAVDIATYGGSREKPIISASLYNHLGKPFVGMSGTSMAAPIVAGAAALILEARPNISAQDVVKLLKDTSSKNQGLELSIRDGNQLNIDHLVQGLAH